MKSILLLLLTWQMYSATAMFEFDEVLIITSNDNVGGTDKGRTFSFESYVKIEELKIGMVYTSYTLEKPRQLTELDTLHYHYFPDLYQGDVISARTDKVRFIVDKPFYNFNYGIGIDMVGDFNGDKIQIRWHKITNGRMYDFEYEEKSYVTGLAYLEYYKESTFYKVDNILYSKLVVGDFIEFDSESAIVFEREGEFRSWVGIGYQWFGDSKSDVINHSHERLQGLKVVLGCQLHNLIVNLEFRHDNAWGTIGYCW